MKRTVFLIIVVFVTACASTKSDARSQPGKQPIDEGESAEVVVTNTPMMVVAEVTDPGTRTNPPAQQESPAYWPTEGWQTSTPEEQGMSSELLAGMLATIQDQEYGIDSVSIVRNGYLVLDAAVYPFSTDSRHVIHSCTKSIVSALIGIALNKDIIESVDQPVLDFFPEKSGIAIDTNKEKMTLEHLLTMSAGLDCRDSYLYSWSGLRQMRGSRDWVKFMLELPMVEEPGTKFEYCNGGSFLLSAIIQETTGKSAQSFAEEFLFGPLGISDVVWPSNPQGINIGWGEIRMQPKDLAKIGYLYLNEGEWDAQLLIPSEWVETSTSKHIAGTLQDGYGYQWWVARSGIYMALGYAGQYLVILPALEMVVVFTSDLKDNEFYVPQGLLYDYVIPAAEASMPLPDNPEGISLLQSRLESLANP
jgi:CubicO group peptidase (beta-lactamase class C family)